jgi:hypothetical protein
MCWFYNLPECLLRGVLSDWVEIADVVWLDSATCSGDRTIYLNMVKGGVVLRSENFLSSPDDASAAMRWVFKRSAALTCVVMNRAFSESNKERVEYLKTKGGCIRAITTSASDFNQVWEPALADLCEYCPTLTFLKWTCPLGYKCICEMLKAWNGLTHVTITQEIPGEGLIAVGKTCQMLSALHVLCYDTAAWTVFVTVCSTNLSCIEQCQLLDDDSCAALAQRCPSLRRLGDLSETVTDSALTMLGKHCPLLERLAFEITLFETAQVTDIGISAIAVNGALTELALLQCDAVTDQGMQAVAQHCPRLARLLVDYCPLLTDNALERVGEHCSALRVLHVAQCCSITHVGLAAIGTGCPLLEELQITWNYRVRKPDTWDTNFGAGVTDIARGCPRLSAFLACGVPMPEEAVLALAQHCPRLEHVGVEGSEVGDAAITQLARSCPELWNLYIFHTSVTN